MNAGINLSENLLTGRVAVGVEVTGAWNRLTEGTGEAYMGMTIEKCELTYMQV